MDRIVFLNVRDKKKKVIVFLIVKRAEVLFYFLIIYIHLSLTKMWIAVKLSIGIISVYIKNITWIELSSLNVVMDILFIAGKKKKKSFPRVGGLLVFNHSRSLLPGCSHYELSSQLAAQVGNPIAFSPDQARWQNLHADPHHESYTYW